MIHSLKPYLAYKDSGVPWLRKVPEHWDVLPGRALFREINDRGHGNAELLSVTISQGVVRQAELLSDSSNKDSSTEDKSAYKLVQHGDIAYNKMRAWQGAIGVSADYGIVSPAYVVQRPRAAHNSSRYFHYLLRTPSFATEAERWSYGITSDQWSLRPEDFRNIYFSVPPPAEQAAIARFLAWADRRIRLVIRARRRRIKLLEEYKQTLIKRAVTGQIDVRTGDLYPTYRPSGVEWLGDVPAHWEVIQFARCIRRIDQGWSPVAAEGGLEEDQWAVLTLSAVRRGHFNPIAVKPIPRTATVPRGIELADGDLLITRSNTRELVGDLCIVQGSRPKTVLCDLIFRLDTDPDVVRSRFLMHQLLSRVGRDQIERGAKGSSGTMPKISQQLIRTWQVVLPPLNEQTQITRWIDATSKRLLHALNTGRREIQLLNELRTRIIADVVTGKLDVREAAAKLPDEPPEDEDEALDEEEAIEEEDILDEDLEAIAQEAAL